MIVNDRSGCQLSDENKAITDVLMRFFIEDDRCAARRQIEARFLEDNSIAGMERYFARLNSS